MHFESNTTVSDVTRLVREQFPTAGSLNLRFGDCGIRVTANQPDILRELSVYFSPFVTSVPGADVMISVHQGQIPGFEGAFTIKQPDPGKTKIKEAYLDLADGRVVHKRLTGMLFVFGEGRNVAVGPCLDNLNQVVNFINNRYIEWELCRGYLLGHAAAVIWKGQGIAIAGFSGAGKSTLSLHLMSRGTDFVSNDRLMINLKDGCLEMKGVAKLPRINPGTILNNPDIQDILSESEKQMFSSLPPEELWQLEHKFDVPIEDCFENSRFLLKSSMKMLAILNWRRSDEPLTFQTVNLEERRDLLPAFMKAVGLFFMPHSDCRKNDAEEADYISMLQHCQVIEFSGGVDFDKAADACLSLVEHGSLNAAAD